MLAPFDDHGNLMHFPGFTYGHDANGKWVGTPPEWREIEPFNAVMQFSSYHRGRSAAYFCWCKVDDNTLWTMFLTDLSQLIETATLYMGKVTATWEVCKRGENYGIRRVSA